MEISGLIDRLSKDIENSSESGGKKISPWSCVVLLLACLSLGLFSLGIREDIFYRLSDPMYVAMFVVSLLGAIVCGVVVVLLSIPGTSTGKLKKVVWSAIAMWLIFLALSIYKQWKYGIFGTEGFTISGLSCSGSLIMLSMIPSAFLVSFVNKSAPTLYWFSGLLIICSATLVSYGVVHLHCMNEHPMHLLVYHVIPAIVLSALGLFLGRKLCNWDRKIQKEKERLGIKD